MKIEHTEDIQSWWNDRQEIVLGDNNIKSKCFNPQELFENGLNFDQCKFPKDEEDVLPPDVLLKQYHEKRAALDKKIDAQLAEIENLLGIKIEEA